MQRLHDMVNISRLDERCNILLLDIMYSLNENNAHQIIRVHITRFLQRYVFDIPGHLS